MANIQQQQKPKKNIRPSKVYKLRDTQNNLRLSDVHTVSAAQRAMFLTDPNGDNIHVQLSGKGEIHTSFGVSLNGLTKNGEYNIVFTLSQTDVDMIEALQQYIIEHVVKHRNECFPSSTKTDDDIRKSFTPMMQPKKERPTGGFYPRTMKSILQPSNMLTEDVIIDVDQTRVLPDGIMAIQGLRWTKIVIRLSLVYIQATKSFGVSQRINIMKLKGSDLTCAINILPDTDDEEEDNQNILPEHVQKKARYSQVE